jgi:hypothetical protein
MTRTRAFPPPLRSGLPDLSILEPKSGKPDFGRGRVREGEGSRARFMLPPPLPLPTRGEGESRPRGRTE